MTLKADIPDDKRYDENDKDLLEEMTKGTKIILE